MSEYTPAEEFQPPEPTDRERAYAERIASAKEHAEDARRARTDSEAIAYALRGLLDIAIARADVRCYEPPF